MTDNRQQTTENTEHSEIRPAKNAGSPLRSENPKSEIICPFCDSSDVELFSLFGSQLLTSEYYCNHCHTVFESVKR